MRYAIDRFEQSKAVLVDDNGKLVVVDKALLPCDAVQGDVLSFCEERYEHDRGETAARRDRIFKAEQLLREKKKG